jgi:hypothetical protein
MRAHKREEEDGESDHHSEFRYHDRMARGFHAIAQFDHESKERDDGEQCRCQHEQAQRVPVAPQSGSQAKSQAAHPADEVGTDQRNARRQRGIVGERLVGGEIRR